MTRAAFWRAWSIWAVSLALTATTITATVLHPLPARLVNFSGNGLNGAVSIVLIGAFATVGALLAWKRPANPIGWLLSAIGLASALAASAVFLAHFPRTLTLATWLGFLYLLGFGLCAVVVLLFPTGKLPSRRWRPVAWAAGAGLAGWVLGCAFAPTIVSVSPPIAEPGRRDRAARRHLQDPGGRRRTADHRRSAWRPCCPWCSVTGGPRRPNAHSYGGWSTQAP